MKKKDKKLVVVCFILFVVLVIGGLLLFTRTNNSVMNNFKSTNPNSNVAGLNSTSKVEKLPEQNKMNFVYDENKLKNAAGNQATYEEEYFNVIVSDKTDLSKPIYLELEDKTVCDQEVLDFSFLPSIEDFPNIKAQPEFMKESCSSSLVSNYVWFYGWHNNYFDDYLLWNYRLPINNELQIGLIGWANDTDVNNLSVEVLVKPTTSPGFESNASKGELEFETIEYADVQLTEQDAEDISYFIEKYDRYPKEDEVELSGIVTYDQYKQLFDMQPLEGRDAHYIVGKSANHDNSL